MHKTEWYLHKITQVLPLAKSTNISKIKVTNRTHAGHSRYIYYLQILTSTFQTTSVLAEDGALFTDDAKPKQAVHY